MCSQEKQQKTQQIQMNKLFKSFFGMSAVLLLATSCYAQKKAINTAEYELNAGQPENFVTAKEEIDKAYANPTTSNDPRMWLIRSMVYSRIFDLKGNELLKPLSAEAGLISATSMVEFWKTTMKVKPEDLETGGFWTANAFGASYNESVGVLESKNYNKAIDYYKANIALFAKLDTATVNALERQQITPKYLTEKLAYIASQSSDSKVKIEVLQEIVDGGSISPMVYESLSRAYLEKGDTIGGERIVREGLKKAPGDNNMFQVLVNFFVTIHQEERLFEDVNKQIEAAPDSKLYYTRGFLNEKKGDYDKAVSDYRESVKLDEWNYDANFNLGLALIKYESNKLYAAKAEKGANRADIDAKLKALFMESRGFLERAAENKNYGIEDQLNIYKALKSTSLEIGDKDSVTKYEDMIKALEASR
jgi:tetratricopeptide (TPR) repeat protein